MSFHSFVASSCPSTMNKIIHAHHDSVCVLKCLWMNNHHYSSFQNQDMLTVVHATLNLLRWCPWRHLFWRSGSGHSNPLTPFQPHLFPAKSASAPMGLAVYFSTSFIPLWYVKECESRGQQIWMQSARIHSVLRAGTYPTPGHLFPKALFAGDTPVCIFEVL